MLSFELHSLLCIRRAAGVTVRRSRHNKGQTTPTTQALKVLTYVLSQFPGGSTGSDVRAFSQTYRREGIRELPVADCPHCPDVVAGRDSVPFGGARGFPTTFGPSHGLSSSWSFAAGGVRSNCQRGSKTIFATNGGKPVDSDAWLLAANPAKQSHRLQSSCR